MSSHTAERDLALFYIAFILAAVFWFTYLLNGLLHSQPSPSILRKPIHDARPVPAAPTPDPQGDRAIYDAQLSEQRHQ
jgi:hypothetical protein